MIGQIVREAILQIQCEPTWNDKTKFERGMNMKMPMMWSLTSILKLMDKRSWEVSKCSPHLAPYKRKRVWPYPTNMASHQHRTIPLESPTVSGCRVPPLRISCIPFETWRSQNRRHDLEKGRRSPPYRPSNEARKTRQTLTVKHKNPTWP